MIFGGGQVALQRIAVCQAVVGNSFVNVSLALKAFKGKGVEHG